jgi:hypothetical protein
MQLSRWTRARPGWQTPRQNNLSTHSIMGADDSAQEGLHCERLPFPAPPASLLMIRKTGGQPAFINIIIVRRDGAGQAGEPAGWTCYWRTATVSVLARLASGSGRLVF